MLNSSFEPIQVVNWQKAFILWFQGKVDVLDTHHLFARTIRETFPIPSIIRLKKYTRFRRKSFIRFSRENVYLRDSFECQYCGVKPLQRELTLDHVLPASRGGDKNWLNVVTACKPCNQKKSNKTPEEARMPLKMKPDEPKWLPEPGLSIDTVQVPESWQLYLIVTHGARRAASGY